MQGSTARKLQIALQWHCKVWTSSDTWSTSCRHRKSSDEYRRELLRPSRSCEVGAGPSAKSKAVPGSSSMWLLLCSGTCKTSAGAIQNASSERGRGLLAGGLGSDGADGGAWSAGARSMLHGPIACKELKVSQGGCTSTGCISIHTCAQEVSAAWGLSKQPRSEVHILAEACVLSVLDSLAYRYQHVALRQA